MPDTPKHIIALSELKREVTFDLAPDADARRVLATELDFENLRKLRFSGSLRPDRAKDWVLKADLGATIMQPCVVTLAPVTTRIDTTIYRAYRADLETPTAAGEVEMPEDDTEEPLPPTLDLHAVMAEALSIAAPDFPRADGVEVSQTAFSAPGVTPLSDEDVKPFAGLQSLKDKMAGNEDGNDDT